MTDSESDADLVRQCLDGDTGAFEVLVRRYQKPVFNAAFRLVNNSEDAKDISQRVFLKAYEKLRTFNPRYKFYSWIYRIAVNEAINAWQKERRLEPLDDSMRTRPTRESGPHEILARSELNNHIQEALMSVSPEYRVVVVLKHFVECTYEDIAQITGLPLKTVKSRLYTARQLLKDYFVKKGLI